jgi:hypothetical protein
MTRPGQLTAATACTALARTLIITLTTPNAKAARRRCRAARLTNIADGGLGSMVVSRC